MNIEHTFSASLRSAAALSWVLPYYGWADAAVRLLQRDAVPTLSFAFLLLAGSALLRFFVLRKWRFAAPLPFAVELGVCGGIGGLGLYIFFAIHRRNDDA